MTGAETKVVTAVIRIMTAVNKINQDLVVPFY